MSDRTCSVDDCDRSVVARGWCRMHYSRWFRHGTIADPRPTPVATCSADCCDRLVKARGWCALHYWRWQHNGSIDDPAPRRRSICIVDGCDGFVVGRGWCRLHYNRWYVHGSTKRPTRTPKPVAICSVDDCKRPAVARSWCSTHWHRWAKYGSLEFPGSEPPEGAKWCRKCLSYKPLFEFARRNGRQSSPCRECTRIIAAEQSRRRRAIKRRSNAELYTAKQIADRDGWRCQLCSKQIGRKLKWPHPRSLSIDHIVPISKGGDDVKSNVQAAHLHCNMSKSTGGVDQLRLIG